MSDSLSDVEKAIVSTLTASFFVSPPNPAVPTASTAIVGGQSVSLRIARDWPGPDDLNTTIAAGQALISVYTVPNMSRNTTRFQPKWAVSSTVEITVAATISDRVVTFTGNGTAGQVVGIGVGLNGYAYRLPGATAPDDIAALFSSVPGATVDGATVSIAGTDPLTADVVSDTTFWREIETIAQRFLISIWAPTPAIRDALGGIVSTTMAATRSFDLSMPGTSTSKPILRAISSPQLDEKDRVYRRDSQYEIEFPIVEPDVATGVLFLGLNINDVKYTA